MAGLAAGRLPRPRGADRELFEKHLAPWMGRFFADLECADEADFYRRVGTLGRVFMEIESEAFALPSHDEAAAEDRGGCRDETKATSRQSVVATSFARSASAAAAAAAPPRSRPSAGRHRDNDEKRKSRYQETEHVKTFYRVNRYPS